MKVILRHSRDTVGDFGKRALMHIPVGILIGIPFLGRPLEKIFKAYEENEDKWVKDQAWKDYFGAMIGIVITEISLLAVIIYFIIRRLLNGL